MAAFSLFVRSREVSPDKSYASDSLERLSAETQRDPRVVPVVVPDSPSSLV